MYLKLLSLSVNTFWFYKEIKWKGKVEKLNLKHFDHDDKYYLRLFNMDFCPPPQFIKNVVLFLPSDEQDTRDNLFCCATQYI
jgi:hypothetical protein